MFGSSSTMRSVATSAPWQLEREARAATGRALEVHAAAVGLHDVAHDREAEAGGAELAAGTILRESFEDPFLLLGRDARSGVGHRDHDRILTHSGLDPDRPSGRRVAERV